MRNWYSIYTKAKAEDSTAQLLNNAGIETLTPKIRIKKYTRKKYVDVVEQLFPCYIFAFFEKDKHSHMITYTRGVRYIVGKETPITVPQEIIDSIKERMEGDIVNPFHEDFKRGERIVIQEGPFKNFYGVFEGKISGKERAMILLETLNCKLDIERRSIRKA